MPAEDVTPAKDSGVLKEIIREGIGDELPYNGCHATVHYTGTLMDDTKFDSSKDRNEPFRFKVGAGHVIKAWDIGIPTMKKGEVAIFTCAPNYAYGKNGCPPKIPGNSVLKFEIEMIDWMEDLSPNEDGGIERIILVPGSSDTSPTEGSLVDVHLIGKYNDKVFDERDVQFYIGEGENDDIIEGIESALQSFKTGEKSRLKIKSKYAFKDEGKAKWDIPSNADIEYIVELKSFEKVVETWSLSLPELVQQAKTFKEKGTSAFKENKYPFAIKMYDKVLSLLNNSVQPQSNEEDVKPERDSLLLSSYLNLALCYLKIDENVKAKEACDKALEMDPQNEKALFRRGQAYLALASPEIAIKDFQEVLKIEPKNTAATKQIAVCNNLIKKQLAIEKKLYANMFEKFAQEDKQKEEEELRQQPDVMHGALGEWGQEERPGGRDATAFEKENPNILMLNANGTGEFQNM